MVVATADGDGDGAVTSGTDEESGNGGAGKPAETHGDQLHGHDCMQGLNTR